MIYEDLQNTGEMVATLGVSDQTSPPPTLPPLPGFHLEGVSRNETVRHTDHARIC